jgi:hypothetical protein
MLDGATSTMAVAQDTIRLAMTEHGAATGPLTLVYSHWRFTSRPMLAASTQDEQPTPTTSTFINRMSKAVVGGCA